MLFQQFDRMLLLTKGGKTVYFGDLGQDSRLLIEYFERYGAQPCEPDENPAEWMLKVIGAAPGSKATRDWAQTWKESPEYKNIDIELSRLEQDRQPGNNEGLDVAEASTYASPFHVQFMACVTRVFQQYWRTPSYIYSKLVLSGGTVSNTIYLIRTP